MDNLKESQSSDLMKIFYSCLEDQSFLNDFKAYMKNYLYNSLKKSNLKCVIEPTSTIRHQRLSPKMQSVNLIMADYLIRQDFLYTLSVFSSEAPFLNNLTEFSNYIDTLAKLSSLSSNKSPPPAPKLLSRDVKEIFEYLGLPPQSEMSIIARQMYMDSEDDDPLILCLIQSLVTNFQNSNRCSSGNQGFNSRQMENIHCPEYMEQLCHWQADVYRLLCQYNLKPIQIQAVLKSLDSIIEQEYNSIESNYNEKLKQLESYDKNLSERMEEAEQHLVKQRETIEQEFVLKEKKLNETTEHLKKKRNKISRAIEILQKQKELLDTREKIIEEKFKREWDKLETKANEIKSKEKEMNEIQKKYTNNGHVSDKEMMKQVSKEMNIKSDKTSYIENTCHIQDTIILNKKPLGSKDNENDESVHDLHTSKPLSEISSVPNTNLSNQVQILKTIQDQSFVLSKFLGEKLFSPKEETNCMSSNIDMTKNIPSNVLQNHEEDGGTKNGSHSGSDKKKCFDKNDEQMNEMYRNDWRMEHELNVQLQDENSKLNEVIVKQKKHLDELTNQFKMMNAQRTNESKLMDRPLDQNENSTYGQFLASQSTERLIKDSAESWLRHSIRRTLNDQSNSIYQHPLNQRILHQRIPSSEPKQLTVPSSVHVPFQRASSPISTEDVFQKYHQTIERLQMESSLINESFEDYQRRLKENRRESWKIPEIPDEIEMISPSFSSRLHARKNYSPVMGGYSGRSHFDTKSLRNRLNFKLQLDNDNSGPSDVPNSRENSPKRSLRSFFNSDVPFWKSYQKLSKNRLIQSNKSLKNQSVVDEDPSDDSEQAFVNNSTNKHSEDLKQVSNQPEKMVSYEDTFIRNGVKQNCDKHISFDDIQKNHAQEVSFASDLRNIIESVELDESEPHIGNIKIKSILKPTINSTLKDDENEHEEFKDSMSHTHDMSHSVNDRVEISSNLNESQDTGRVSCDDIKSSQRENVPNSFKITHQEKYTMNSIEQAPNETIRNERSSKEKKTDQQQIYQPLKEVQLNSNLDSINNIQHLKTQNEKLVKGTGESLKSPIGMGDTTIESKENSKQSPRTLHQEIDTDDDKENCQKDNSNIDRTSKSVAYDISKPLQPLVNNNSPPKLLSFPDYTLKTTVESPPKNSGRSLLLSLMSNDDDYDESSLEVSVHKSINDTSKSEESNLW